MATSVIASNGEVVNAPANHSMASYGPPSGPPTVFNVTLILSGDSDGQFRIHTPALSHTTPVIFTSGHKAEVLKLGKFLLAVGDYFQIEANGHQSGKHCATLIFEA